MFLSPFHMEELELISLASNIKSVANNPPFSVEKFLEIYPQFVNKLPLSVVNFYISLANNSLSFSRWGDSWEMGMVLFIAHHLTLYLMAMSGIDENSPASRVVSASLAAGLTASKSAGSLSKSYDYGSINDDLVGVGTWKLTLFGQQFATMAKLIGKGGSYIW